MKCLLCNKEYINLGVNLRRKHQVDLNDYKEEFGILKTAPLVDKHLSDHLSKKSKLRLLDKEYKEQVTQRCIENAKNNIGKSRTGLMSQAGLDKLSKRNAENHKKRLDSLVPVVDKILKENKTLVDVKRQIGMGREAVLKLVDRGCVTYDKKIALLVGTQRRIISRDNNKKKGTS